MDTERNTHKKIGHEPYHRNTTHKLTEYVILNKIIYNDLKFSEKWRHTDDGDGVWPHCFGYYE